MTGNREGSVVEVEVAGHDSPTPIERSVVAKALLGAFALGAVVAFGQSAKPFYYDAGAYWDLSNSFTQSGSFSLLNFSDALRGYAFPLVNLGLAKIAGALGWPDASIVKLFNAVVFALIGAVLAPALAERVWPSLPWSIARRLALSLLLVVFWRGYLDYPLTDMPALALALVALIASARSYSVTWMFTCGCATAAAINFRPAYIVLLPIVAGLVLADRRCRGRSESAARHRPVFSIVVLVVGMLIVSLPQVISTNRHHNKISFVPGAAAGLSQLQLSYGLQMQRYDTYVGGEAGPRMVYGDPVGARLLKEEGSKIESAGQYAALAVSHPVEMAGIFARHVINGLDQRYSTPYLEEFNSRDNIPTRAAGFFLVFIALARVGWATSRRALGPSNWRYLTALMLCAAPALVSAVETRFMLPAFLASWIVVLAPGWRDTGRALVGTRRPAILALCLLAGLVLAGVVVATVVEGAMNNFYAGS